MPLAFCGASALLPSPEPTRTAACLQILSAAGFYSGRIPLPCQYRYGSSYLEMQLRLMEHEFRDVELAISMAESRRDVDVLKAKIEVLKAQSDAEKGALNGVVVGDDALLAGEDAPNSYASQLIEQLQLDMVMVRSGANTAAGTKPPLRRSKTLRLQQAGQKVVKALKPQSVLGPGYESRYPCYVISLSRLAKLDRLRPHEELLEAGLPYSPLPRAPAVLSCAAYLMSCTCDAIYAML